ncbi:MAG: imidazoleglycerol-phosphate dehydratase HisB [Opitutales bacterium]|nr:imidazoleglycerol-phosphate dehydratase HisB [Opitutales bacterium]MCH8539148.1 imidazoleglycerol-phosphate dehydratase HisB [Opitutales bacterium]
MSRTSQLTRETSETKINLSLNLDGTGDSSIKTGIPFFDHMLELFARHGLYDLEVKAEGDLEVDYHHTVEDTGLVLGQAIREAVGDKKGIRRYGFFMLPMDETLARVVLDLSGRPYLNYQVTPRSWYVRDFNLALVEEFFRAFTNSLGANVHAAILYGEEPHHLAEALFKCLARALNEATSLDPARGDQLPSTKGKLD